MAKKTKKQIQKLWAKQEKAWTKWREQFTEFEKEHLRDLIIREHHQDMTKIYDERIG